MTATTTTTATTATTAHRGRGTISLAGQLGLCRDVLAFSPDGLRRAVRAGSARGPLVALFASGTVAYGLAQLAAFADQPSLSTVGVLVGGVVATVVTPAFYGVLLLVATVVLRKVSGWVVPGGLLAGESLRLLGYASLPFTVQYVLAVPIIAATGEPFLLSQSGGGSGPFGALRSSVFALWALALVVVGLTAVRRGPKQARDKAGEPAGEGVRTAN
jgi:hypothetical protein